MNTQIEIFKEAIKQTIRHELSRIEDAVMESDATKQDYRDIESLADGITTILDNENFA